MRMWRRDGKLWEGADDEADGMDGEMWGAGLWRGASDVSGREMGAIGGRVDVETEGGKEGEGGDAAKWEENGRVLGGGWREWRESKKRERRRGEEGEEDWRQRCSGEAATMRD